MENFQVEQMHKKLLEQERHIAVEKGKKYPIW